MIIFKYKSKIFPKQLLDDNRELFLPETQEVVKAHEKFLVFATQNPPGRYGGRKASGSFAIFTDVLILLLSYSLH